MQNYYGIAIRQNVGNLKEMKAAIHASLFHVASSKENQWHDHCPQGPSSWCQYQRAKVDDSISYKLGPGIPLSIIVQDLKQIYNDLSSDDLLKKFSSWENPKPE